MIYQTLQPTNISDPQTGYNYHYSSTEHVPSSHYVSEAQQSLQPSNSGTSGSLDSTTQPHIQPPSHTDSSSPEDWQAVTPPSATAENGRAGLLGATSARVEQYPTAQKQIPEANQPELKVWEDEDDPNDPWDVMDEDIDEELSKTVAAPTVPMEDLQLLRRVHAPDNVLQNRSYTTFLNSPNILARYRPSYISSPLNDEKTARIFAHFISATGQSISIYERNFTNTSGLFLGQTLAPSQQSLWTYTLPMLALENPPLMHAILALSALHISKLQETSIGPSTKHFHYALRRVAKLIGLPQRRNEIATLAANLVLGFYEVMCAEHSKWTIHLQGASILIRENDFASMARTIRSMRDHAKAVIGTMSPPPDMQWRDIWKETGYPENLLDPRDWEIDDKFVSDLCGFHVRYYEPSEPHGFPDKIMTEKDIDEYKLRSDLFWWYCKQDLFQSMVSGNQLLMPYEFWTTNPPRSQFGRQDVPYGTFDHLILLMARLADWGAKDRKRKLKVMEANGGQWRPPPGFFPARPPAQGPASGAGPPAGAYGPSAGIGAPERGRELPQGVVGSPGMGPPPGTSAPSRPPMPPFHGMMPPQPARMESAYATVSNNLHDPYRAAAGVEQTQTSRLRYRRSSDYEQNQSQTEATQTQQNAPKSDLDNMTEQALQEHASIARAFELFASSLPQTFSPLTPAQSPPIDTPFGPALQYRTHIIACIHIHYNTGLLLLNRFHPHMPPAAMMATGVSAWKTTEIANTIGRICGSLYDGLSSTTSRMATPVGPHFMASTQPMPAEILHTTHRTRDDMSPALGAALMESTFPLFFAAVQYIDPQQRSWTITRLRDIARCTGWQTSAAVAAGCEAAWSKMGMGKAGPPHGPPLSSMGIQMPGPPHGPPPGAPSAYPTYIPMNAPKAQAKDLRVQTMHNESHPHRHGIQQQSQTYTSFTHLRPLGPMWESTDSSTSSQPPTSSSVLHQQPPSSPALAPAEFSFSIPPTTQATPYSSSDPILPSNYDSNERILPIDEETPESVSHDRRFIGSNPAVRVHWALGILGLEKDMKALAVRDSTAENSGGQ
ncbi:putative c6 finger domain [Phaeomoniella chlamydospora]|uniref:Putative c6 finger domain n=1 Tax=Phaeomoniella chlamydospora TaxID=158046 RepID=A0A0G2EF59_PHACM|nr:putative c6 finger domain [Phaeomoniella chlamydospora]